MKIIKVVRNELRGFGLTDEQLEYELQKAGFNPNDEVVDIGEFTTSKEFELMKARCALDHIITQSESWSQGDRSEKRNFDSLMSYISNIYRKYGLPDPLKEDETPTITRL